MLYICATPIGNLQDISLRALSIFASVDILLCEDTRTSSTLLKAHGIYAKRLISMHEHNENEIADKVIGWLQEGLSICQISDAGTPGISDPGARLCQKVLAHDLPVSPIPGACAYTALLSVSGLSVSSLFYGFLPNKSVARKKILQQWLVVDYAVCVYEAPHRIVDCLADMLEIFGHNRDIVMGRELTKQFETIRKCKLGELVDFVNNDPNQQRGEFVLLICPAIIEQTSEEILSVQQIKVLNSLLAELPPKKAIKLTLELVGGNKELMYQYSIDNKA